MLETNTGVIHYRGKHTEKLSSTLKKHIADPVGHRFQ